MSAKENSFKGMNFSEALIGLKNNMAVARKGWNGKGMFIFLVSGRSFKTTKMGTMSNNGLTREFLESKGCVSLDILPHIDMFSADKKQVVGWLASQTDILADDWELVKF